MSRREEPYTYTNFVNVIWNQDPVFVDPGVGDFHFSDSSPLSNSGDGAHATGADLEGVARNLSAPDIGAYEKI
ncbi:MAG: hypothetical protein IPG07_01845 [Crocinitomicaceae bacterium]|nr:hypothetical protein [Crocinitomicaceae bacterium]